MDASAWTRGTAVLLTAIGLVGLAACDSDESPMVDDVEALTIALSQTVVTLEVGEVVTVEAVLVNRQAEQHYTRLAWQSSEPEVAAIYLSAADETAPQEWWSGSDDTPLGGPDSPTSGQAALIRALSPGSAMVHIRAKEALPGHFIAERHLRIWVREAASPDPGA